VQVISAEGEAAGGRSRGLVVGHRHRTGEGHVAGVLDEIAVGDDVADLVVGHGVAV
jgi:hypothetical protein